MKRIIVGLSVITCVNFAVAEAWTPLQTNRNAPQVVSQPTPVYNAPLQSNPVPSYSTQQNTNVYSVFAEYSGMNAKIKGEDDKLKFKGVGIGISSLPEQLFGGWVKLEHLKTSQDDYDYTNKLTELSAGFQTNLLVNQTNQVYLLGTVGLGLAKLKNEEINETLMTFPVGLEAGYKVSNEFSIYSGVGYKFLSNLGSGKCRDGSDSTSSGRGTCSHHGGVSDNNDESIRLNGTTYKVGLRYNF